MNDQKQQVKTIQKQTGKKVYRKPALQVYGTLNQMTGANPGTGTASDNGQTAAPTRRT
jgi:hypothetical protein